jgi:hypothetical protein
MYCNDTLDMGALPALLANGLLPSDFPTTGVDVPCTTQFGSRSISLTLSCVTYQYALTVNSYSNSLMHTYLELLVRTLTLEYHFDRRRAEAAPGNLRFVEDRCRTVENQDVLTAVPCHSHTSHGIHGYPTQCRCTGRSVTEWTCRRTRAEIQP